MRNAIRASLFFLGVAVPIAVVALVTFVREPLSSPAPEALPYGPNTDIRAEGPLGGGRKVSPAEAAAALKTDMPLPPTNQSTGPRLGVWLVEGIEKDAPTQVGVVWDTEMRFYVSSAQISEEALVKNWEAGAAEAGSPFELTTVRGRKALAREGDGEAPSSLSWLEGGLKLEIVSPAHTVGELKALLEEITYVAS